MNIQQVNLTPNTSLGLLEPKEQNKETSFSSLFMEAVKNADKLSKTSEDYTVKLAAGEVDSLHEVMIAAQKSEVALQLVIEIRNKVLDAYREITRMQI
ncbi:flagellar hook-basal body complex protein FliE [Alkaliphilus pronyensis]|uniref:Flagellar hook-basal body complex protein FliE n=1 Tax=Alkaliphilus pronyensis TaxID=1482732 RepID=A0A6I0F1Q3_9FIRM|nr:flagellar hook-basal body complex protein FliE [Alkaliphilus pronyensis]KAB3535887.1 flagellar hook-basal body complex protein FliE [Alkaliphilus pronyensis]